MRERGSDLTSKWPDPNELSYGMEILGTDPEKSGGDILCFEYIALRQGSHCGSVVDVNFYS